MGELKSAWEIALEKSKKLGKMSAEEEQQYLEEKYRQIGTAAVRRYLDDPRVQSLTSQLKAYSEEENELIKRAAISELIASLDLRDPAKLNEACQGIASLEPESQSVLEQIAQLGVEYEGARRDARREMENKDREVLHRLRISGTAIGDMNVEASVEWQEKEQSLMATFAPRLDNFKQELREKGSLSPPPHLSGEGR